MPSNNLLLIKTFLKSTSNINVLKHSKDKAKRKFAKNSLIGQIVVNVVLLSYATLLSVGLATSEQATVIPEMCALILLGMPFIFTLFKANGYLFGFKEYDMIMSMPFTVKSIVASKFWYMYLMSMPMYGLISLAMLIGYAVGGLLTLWSCIMWIVMTIALPILPMVLASALGAITVRIGSGFKYKNIAQAVFIVILLIPVFLSRFFIENTIRNDEIEEVMTGISDSINSSSAFLPPAKWFSQAINEGSILSFLLVVGLAFIVYELFFILISKFYRKMNSQLAAGSGSKKYELTEQKQTSMVKSIAYKEFKRMTGSTTYLLNAGMGQIMVAIMGVAFLFVKPEKIIESIMQGAPIEAAILFPAIPMLLYFMIGMAPTTCMSPSLEGKNYWIMQTLPISPMDDNKGKILYNFYLSIPVITFATITASICFRVSLIDAIASVIAMISLCVYSSVFGLRSGLKHRKLDWNNEIEVIKQGMAVSMYIIPHMISCLLLMPLVVVANYYLHNTAIIMLGLTLVAWILVVLAWKGVKKYTPA